MAIKCRTEKFIMYMSLSGHMYFGSPYELADKCGTCDGARCDICKEVYTIENLETGKILYSGYDKEEAESILESEKVED